ncbi:MAG: helix-turn-helix domain-containing protein [Rhizomicrobium sp.]|jgi:chromosomal replication initiation ATPase DnaA
MMKSAAVQVKGQQAGSPMSPVREQAWLVQAAVAHVSGVALKDLCATTRRPPKAAFARQIAMYLSHIVFKMSPAEVARVFGRDPSTVGYALRRIEELREDPEVDRTLDWLEAMLRRAGRSP